MPEDEPVDGFTVERLGDRVILIFSSRYGKVDRFWFTLEDARRIGESLVLMATSASDVRLGPFPAGSY